jgi:multicomponent Na+:H+ antiporter subunit D
MADLAIKIAEDPDRLLVNTSSILLLVAFSIKAGLFPFFFWLPASYHTPAPAVSAVFAGLLTKVGVYALIRAFTLFFTQDLDFSHTLLLWLAVFTMITGVLGAASQMTMRKILSFHIISQIGYMILGLALMTPLALAGAIFYLIHHIIVKTNLFLVGGWVTHAAGSDDLKKVGGFFKAAPWITLLFFISAFSLGGIPPLSGFWVKLLVIWAGLDSGAYIATAAALLVGALTLYSMTKIWANVFWKARPDEGKPKPYLNGGALRWIPIAALASMTLFLSFFGRPLYQMSARAADSILDPNEYISAVLGEAAIPESITLAKLEVETDTSPEEMEDTP